MYSIGNVVTSNPLTNSRFNVLSCTTVFTTANRVRPYWAVECLSNSWNMSIPFLANHWQNQIKDIKWNSCSHHSSASSKFFHSFSLPDPRNSSSGPSLVSYVSCCPYLKNMFTKCNNLFTKHEEVLVIIRPTHPRSTLIISINILLHPLLNSAMLSTT